MNSTYCAVALGSQPFFGAFGTPQARSLAAGSAAIAAGVASEVTAAGQPGAAAAAPLAGLLASSSGAAYRGGGWCGRLLHVTHGMAARSGIPILVP